MANEIATTSRAAQYGLYKIVFRKFAHIGTFPFLYTRDHTMYMTERSYSFDVITLGSKNFSGLGYWVVRCGPIILQGLPCRDITRAKARAAHYVDSGKALKRLKYLLA